MSERHCTVYDAPCVSPHRCEDQDACCAGEVTGVLSDRLVEFVFSHRPRLVERDGKWVMLVHPDDAALISNED